MRNPAFDVTPARYITAIITERGVAGRRWARRWRELAGAPSGGAALAAGREGQWLRRASA